MRDYVLRRLLLLPLTFIGITFVAFCFTRFVPGGPIEQAMAERQQADQKRGSGKARPTGPASPEELDNLKRRYGFDRPLVEAYAIWLGVWPGPALQATARLDAQGIAQLEVADETKPGGSVKIKVTAEGNTLTVRNVDGSLRTGWKAEPAPLPDDPDGLRQAGLG